ncbi:hypothetical protein Tco_1261403 [Tanacetum coccineum]
MPIGKSYVQTLQQSDMQLNGQSLDYSHQSSSSLHTPLEPNLFSTIHQNNSSSSSASTYSQTLRSETSAYKSTVNQTSSSLAPSMDEQDEIDENYEMTLVKEKVEPIKGLYKLTKWADDHVLKRVVVTNAHRPDAELVISTLLDYDHI